MRVGGQSEVGRLLSVAVKPAGDAFGSAAAVDRQWRDLGYTAPPELAAATSEYRTFLALLETAGADVLSLPPDDRVGLDSLYARDASIVCDAGVILCNMGKPQRRTEPAAHEAALHAAGVPICGRIMGDGRLEGGDVCWIDQRTLVDPADVSALEAAVAHDATANRHAGRVQRRFVGGGRGARPRPGPRGA